MIDTDRQPDDVFVIPDVVDPAAAEALARRSMAVTGTPQRIHYHRAGDPCRGHGCALLEP